MQLPSKELLSEVLGGSDIEEIHIISNTLIFKYSHFIKGHFQYRRKTEINIYELAYKCKEWAVKQGYKIRIDAHDYMEDDSFSGTYWWVNRLRPKTWQEEGCPNCGANSTEPEAIFAACQWVLDNKDN